MKTRPAISAPSAASKITLAPSPRDAYFSERGILDDSRVGPRGSRRNSLPRFPESWLLRTACGYHLQRVGTHVTFTSFFGDGRMLRSCRSARAQVGSRDRNLVADMRGQIEAWRRFNDLDRSLAFRAGWRQRPRVCFTAFLQAAGHR